MRSLLLIVIVLLSGCFTEKKAVKQLSNIQAKYPNVMVRHLNSFYPVRTEYKDKVILKDTFIEKKVPFKVEVPCPDGTKATVDTVIDCSDSIQIKEVISFFEDSLKIAAMALQNQSVLDSNNRQLTKAWEETQASKEEIRKKEKTILIYKVLSIVFGSLFALSILFGLVRSKLKI